MDNQAPVSNVSEEQTRELLIAISSSVPDYLSDSSNVTFQQTSFDDNSNVNGDDINEQYISELISISDTQPGDATLPIVVTHKG